MKASCSKKRGTDQTAETKEENTQSQWAHDRFNIRRSAHHQGKGLQNGKSNLYQTLGFNIRSKGL